MKKSLKDRFKCWWRTSVEETGMSEENNRIAHYYASVAFEAGYERGKRDGKQEARFRIACRVKPE